MASGMTTTPFALFNADLLASPVVVAVPHAGRAYPPSMPMLRLPLKHLLPLEDRYADRLAASAIANKIATIVAHTPRLWIDLNRAESELDPAMVQGGQSGGAPLPPRVRGGLGLIPRRLHGVGEIWREPLTVADIATRIDRHHRPWHVAVDDLIRQTRAKFGTALLIDLHSMPPIVGNDAPSIVIGDRFGRSAAPQITAAAEAIFAGAGYRVAANTPYAGGYTLDRHAHPETGIHALQIEIDRTLYLDARLDQPGANLSRMQALVADLTTGLADELIIPKRAAAE
jgi:N-formylglutamate amidohydrolase